MKNRKTGGPNMIAVITGDIINSRDNKSTKWLILLKNVLNEYGKTPEGWEIFRGDSFQLEVNPVLALKAALHIKAGIRLAPNMDVRMGIGIGEKDHESNKITESNGTAFVNSGECFEDLKKQTLAIKSNNPETDEQINLSLELALLTMNQWSPAVSLVVKTAIENPELNQKDLAKMLNKSQSSISEAMKRAGFDEVMRMEERYRKLIQGL